MSLKYKIRPQSYHPVRELAELAGIDVSNWEPNNRFLNSEWAFVDGNIIVLNLWYEEIRDEEKTLLWDINFRRDAQKQTNNRRKIRAEKVDRAIQKASQDSLPIHVIICDGDRRDVDDPESKPSSVKLRELDSRLWRVIHYDQKSGDCLLLRDVIENLEDSEVDKPRQTNPNWTRQELILALDLYLQFKGELPALYSEEIVSLSMTLNLLNKQADPYKSSSYRNTNSVRMKLMNFRRFDPKYINSGRKGLSKGNKLEEEIWNEFSSHPDRCHQIANTIKAIAYSDAPEDRNLLLADDTLPEAPEGRLLTRTHSVRERNPDLVKKCKDKFRQKHGELFCQACDFRPQDLYGNGYERVIECHHIKPLSEYEPGEKTKLSDLVLLCGNCHSVVHAKKQWLSLEQLKAILNNRSG